ncbi:MAG TPA: phosphoserine transaminase [Caulobacteraceae bacterium]|nr:phosphoserine transaminase [Caulobacteraceae bacterium]
MSLPAKPSRRPERPWFSSGPTAKRPGWKTSDLAGALIGRNIRAPAVLARFRQGVEMTREVLEVPPSHRIVLVPGSDTGAMEAAMWGLLGCRPVQVMAYENFGKLWKTDLLDHLGVGAEVLSAPFGRLPGLGQVNPAADLVFVWNGTTSGVRVPNADFIAADREGLTICDATSAAFAMDLDWDKLDVVTFSFQKALGGEAGAGMAVLSPRAIERLNTYVPPRPLPKVIRLQADGKADEALFDGGLINTFSLLTLEDWMDALRWASRIGGLAELKRRTLANYEALEAWVERTPWIDFVARDRAIRSETSVCLEVSDPAVAGLLEAERHALLARMISSLEREDVAYDVNAHRSAPPGLRIWCGCTVETADLEALTPWLEWAYAHARAEVQAA